jgi:PAS domain S-box-containing protein
MQTISLLNIPVIKQGKPAGILCITQCVPRAWTDLEIRLATESAERTWAAVERGRAESALRESEARLARVLEVETVGVMFWDLTTGRMTNANDAFLDLMGYSRQELEAGELTWQRLTPPEYVEVSLAELRKFKLSGRIGPYEKEYFHKDGSRHWLVFAGSSLGGDACVEFCVDISGRKRVEAALRESEERYRGLFESIDEGFCIIEMLFDENGRAHDYRFVEANPAFEVQTGLVGAKGRTIREMAPRLDERWFEIYGEVALSGQPIRFDEESNHMDPPRHYDVYAFRYGPAEKRQVAVLFNDVSARKRMDEALRKANRELAEADQRKNEFLAMLSHELRNPLAPIANSVYVIDRAAPGGEQAKRAIRVIDRQVTHMTRLIDELLDVTRISRGKVRLQRESLELNAVVRGTCEDFRELFQRHGIALEIAIPAEPVRVFADRTRIAQVVGNLLQNAVKFTPSGGWATLSLEATGGEAVIEVRDTGAGLDPGLLEKLFVPFMQADQTLDRSAGGLGLGLALVKGLVELHGGRVHAASDGPGRGAVFTMRLPLESKAGSGREVSPGAPRANQALKLLIVEDNKDAAVSLKEVLELTGYQVAMAFTGTEGVRMARALRPDAVLCDIGLPEIDGYGVARLLREDPSTRELFLVALSGYAAPEDLEKSRDAGFDHHVAKPPSIEALQTLLDHRGASRAETA